MVKSIAYTIVAIILCTCFFVWTDSYIKKQFGQFYVAVDALYDKVEEGDATREDAYAVRDNWTDKKKKLHVFIPHNDISYIDYWLNEACGLIYTDDFDLALGKLEVLKELAKSLPDSYTVSFENVF